MRKAIVSLALSLTLLSGAVKSTAQITTIASDSKIVFVGRTNTIEGDVAFDWTGTYARIKFKGDYLSVNVSDTKKNYYNFWIDSSTDEKPYKVFTTSGSDTTIVLFEAQKKDKKAIHEAIIQKRTEGEQGLSTFHSFTSQGEVLQAERLKDRQIEFIGDSYSCGYGTESGKGTHFKPETENVNYAYGPIVSRYFNADYTVVAHSGMGIARNYNDNVKNYYMPDRYLRTFDGNRDLKWNSDSATFRPAITVILLGTNDFSVSRQPSLNSFTANYIKLLKEIKDNYGEDYPVLCCAAKGDIVLFDYIRSACGKAGMKNIHYMNYGDAVFNNEELGADGHPNYYAHRKIAHSVIPYISTLTGWPINDNIK